MEKNIYFIELYRGETSPNKYNELEIENTIERIDLTVKSYLGGVSLNVLMRQTGLTEEEIKEMPYKQAAITNKLNKYKKKCKNKKQITDEEIYLRLMHNKDYVVQRLIDGDLMQEIGLSLGIPVRGNVIKKFRRELQNQGYLVHDISLFNRLMHDLTKNLSLIEIVQKYHRIFHSEQDVVRCLRKHNIDTKGLAPVEYI